MPTTQPLISIPILTYNGEKYLREQLDSIYAQTYKNIEVLAFDDGSTDKTVSILHEYHLKFGLQYTVHAKNLGFLKNGEYSLKACTGDYIAPSDQDDIWKEHKLEVLMNAINNNMLIYADSSTMDEQGTKFDDHYFGSRWNLIEGNEPLKFVFGNSISAHAMLFKRELVDKALPLPDTMDFHDWWLVFCASCLDNIVLYPEPLVYYRRHDRQVTNVNKKKSYTLFKRFKFREQRLIKNRTKILEMLKSFQSYQYLDPKKAQLLLDIFNNMILYKTVYYNKELEKLLTENADTLFYISKKSTKKSKKQISRLCGGIWYHRIRLYT